jgi:hypothetical protein
VLLLLPVGAIEQSASGSTEQLLAHQGRERCQVQGSQKNLHYTYQYLVIAQLTGLLRNTSRHVAGQAAPGTLVEHGAGPAYPAQSGSQITSR